MSIPEFQTLLLPFLRIVADRHEHHIDEVIEKLAEEFELTEADRRELLPTGIQGRFENHVRWVRIHFGKARLLETTGRDKFCVSRRGLDLLETNPTELSLNDLLQYPEYADFRNLGNQGRRPAGEVH